MATVTQEKCRVCGNQMLDNEVFYTGEHSPFDVEPCTKCKKEINAKLKNSSFGSPWIIGKGKRDV